MVIKFFAQSALRFLYYFNTGEDVKEGLEEKAGESDRRQDLWFEEQKQKQSCPEVQ